MRLTSSTLSAIRRSTLLAPIMVDSVLLNTSIGALRLLERADLVVGVLPIRGASFWSWPTSSSLAMVMVWGSCRVGGTGR